MNIARSFSIGVDLGQRRDPSAIAIVERRQASVSGFDYVNCGAPPPSPCPKTGSSAASSASPSARPTPPSPIASPPSTNTPPSAANPRS